MNRKKGRLGRFRDKFQFSITARIYDGWDGQTKNSQGPIRNAQGGDFFGGWRKEEGDVKNEVVLDFKFLIFN